MFVWFLPVFVLAGKLHRLHSFGAQISRFFMTKIHQKIHHRTGRTAFRVRWWNPSTGVPQQPQRQAMVQAQIAELVASGQPKDGRKRGDGGKLQGFSIGFSYG